mmetsp:Transcript_72229/g.187522  ORF Transcript_72229/g.187522 Transcript_72229/m.187522 type:complete len:112 (-) Transcript_72229:186-521(-)
MFASMVANCRTIMFLLVKNPGKLFPFSQPLFSGAPELPAIGASVKIKTMQIEARPAQMPTKAAMPSQMLWPLMQACIVLNFHSTTKEMTQMVQKLISAIPAAVKRVIFHMT